jgi:hypothetical protein
MCPRCARAAHPRTPCTHTPRLRTGNCERTGCRYVQDHEGSPGTECMWLNCALCEEHNHLTFHFITHNFITAPARPGTESRCGAPSRACRARATVLVYALPSVECSAKTLQPPPYSHTLGYRSDWHGYRSLWRHLLVHTAAYMSRMALKVGLARIAAMHFFTSGFQ